MMAEEIKKTKVEEKEVKVETEKVVDRENSGTRTNTDDTDKGVVGEKVKEQDKKDVKDSVKKVEKVVKKPAKKKAEVKVYDKAVANGFGLKISPKQCKYTCRVIRGKSPEAAIARLQAVIDEKRPVPMAALEVGHKKGKGLAGGRFPKNACRGIMEIVKQAGANAVVLGIENPVVAIARSDRAAAPYRKAGRKAKRTNLLIEVRDKTKMMRKKK